LALSTYACTILGSAFLLFLVQPMVGKMILPRFGGEPSVLAVLMLLVGSAHTAAFVYAYLVARLLPYRAQLILQTALWAIPLPFLPFMSVVWMPPPETSTIFTLLALLLPTALLPVFLFSSSAFLLQVWFTQTNSLSRNDPYFLYSFSNLGSLVSLLIYPFLIEPNLTLHEQSWCWSIGYVLVFVLLVLSGAIVWMTRAPESELPLDRITILCRLGWVVFSALPVILLLGGCGYLMEEMSPTPLLWIVPLSLYLLSLVLTFMRWPVNWSNWPHRILLVSFPLALLLFGTLVFVLGIDSKWGRCGTMAGFFFVALVCHGMLARNRPSTRYLTSFYLWIKVGEVIGGTIYSIYSLGMENLAALLLG